MRIDVDIVIKSEIVSDIGMGVVTNGAELWAHLVRCESRDVIATADMNLFKRVKSQAKVRRGNKCNKWNKHEKF
ncbi:hypothetical protein EVAR_92333_1 [Eumeta japonica]|uniref:Uncharacterized protein n=1 Tax=Eumeta variegata TaxID=151549 RepID=A0A4C1TII8_EUMVA|nr:hypothetical protein EVAR_92333_1 [Eumeta japonica]